MCNSSDLGTISPLLSYSNIYQKRSWFFFSSKNRAGSVHKMDEFDSHSSDIKRIHQLMCQNNGIFHMVTQQCGESN